MVAIPPAHIYYIITGAGATIFTLAPECRRLAGFDPSEPDAVEVHANATTEPDHVEVHTNAIETLLFRRSWAGDEPLQSATKFSLHDIGVVTLARGNAFCT